jgi:hypothetical protein
MLNVGMKHHETDEIILKLLISNISTKCKNYEKTK